MICEIKNPDRGPLGGWYFDAPTDVEGETVRIPGATYRALLKNVAGYFNNRGMEVPSDLVNQINCQVCDRTPGSYCVQESEGLGDTIAKVTRVTGLKRVLQYAKGGDCASCGGRQKKLNKAVPYTRKTL